LIISFSSGFQETSAKTSNFDFSSDGLTIAAAMPLETEINLGVFPSDFIS